MRDAVSRRSPLLFYSLAALLAIALAFGPGGEASGPPSPLHPYSWLLELPGYRGLRVPARFAMLAVLCLSVAAGVALARLSIGRRWGRVVAALAIAGVAADGWTEPVPLVAPPPRVSLDQAPPASVIEIPTDDPLVSVGAMYRGIFHGRPVVNGYTGHIPPHYAVLSHALRRGDVSVLPYLARSGPLVIVVNRVADPDGGFRQMIEAVPGVTPLNISRVGPVFLLPRVPDAPREAGRTVPAPARPVEGNRVLLDCGEPRELLAIEFPLRLRYPELAERLLIEVSDDGREWREAWLGWTGAFALDAALRDPLVAPVRIPFAVTRARYLRIYPAPAWLAEEIGVRAR